VSGGAKYLELNQHPAMWVVKKMKKAGSGTCVAAVMNENQKVYS
jgi:hypothetical protein